MKIQHIDAPYTHEFDFISNPDGTCHSWLCTNPGAVLVYDDFCPEFGLWFCAECWPDFAAVPFFVIVKDTRERPGEP